MEPAELYFRRLDAAQAREDFLEKEMLDSDVRHVELRGQFIDKIAVLAAGSLAVAISFMIAGFEHAELQQAIQQHFWLFGAALGLLLLSLLLCIVHSVRIATATTLLSCQLQYLYKGANVVKDFMRANPHQQIPKDSVEDLQLIEYDNKAKSFMRAKARSMLWTMWIGNAAVVALSLGYGCGVFQAAYIYHMPRKVQPASAIDVNIRQMPVEPPNSAAPLVAKSAPSTAKH